MVEAEVSIIARVSHMVVKAMVVIMDAPKIAMACKVWAIVVALALALLMEWLATKLEEVVLIRLQWLRHFQVVTFLEEQAIILLEVATTFRNLKLLFKIYASQKSK
jgi:hypothetical protein